MISLLLQWDGSRMSDVTWKSIDDGKVGDVEGVPLRSKHNIDDEA
jgi:hypothetical protein